MNILIRKFAAALAGLLVVTSVFLLAGVNLVDAKGVNRVDVKEVSELDVNEELHLIFMREEEKLARDVYIMFSKIYFTEPESQVFFNIVESETRHTLAVLNVMEAFDLEDPVTSNAEVGEFSSEQFGTHFEEAFSALVSAGTEGYAPYPEDHPDYYVEGLLAALYVGAFIEELDMHDIEFCPHEITDYDPQDLIVSETDCGKEYTDEENIERLYGNLLDGSENHLRAYVHGIEKVIGAGNYQAQYLSQEQVDEILGR